ncbi:hypothetical protein ACFPES_20125 [Paenibacillus sp. GCM10023248]|uniref:hypothetical protein n=1 Tax=unclassified Paenibacillus TaxID=185978 RepID=UPI00360B5359
MNKYSGSLKDFIFKSWSAAVQVGGPGPVDHPAATHKIVYDAKTFVEVFEKAGFEVSLLEYCDEEGDFH